MRKKLLTSIFVAVICIAALSATAFAVELTGPSTVTNGSEIDIKVTGTMKGLAANVTTTGLEFISVNGGLSDEETLILLEDFGGMEGVYKYRVTAPNGDTVSFALTDVYESDGEQDIPANNMTWSGTVGGSFSTTTSTPNPTQNNAGQQQGAAAGAAQGANSAAVQQSSGAGAVTPALSADAAASASVSAVPTDGPQTADGSVSVWLLCIGAAACAVIAVLIGRKMFKKA